MQSEILRTHDGYIIRLCTPEQVKEVIDVNMKTLPEHYSDEFYYELLESFPEGFIVAQLGEKVVGYIMNRVEFGFSNMKSLSILRKGHVVSVAVLPEHRGKGLGRVLVEEGLRAAKEKGCREMYLEVRVTNSIAIRLYESLGFSIKQKLYRYYRDGEDAYLMARPLN
ncbi:MAG: ribosomal protein S18-alanine N-acetyltransferase [Conexivisphaerales archaeon]